MFFRSLPRFDPYILETYLDDLRELKRQVYDLFKYKPELLPGPELSKGAAQALPPMWLGLRQRQLVKHSATSWLCCTADKASIQAGIASTMHWWIAAWQLGSLRCLF